jgi:site-specific DNA-methyltransferase (cytosine-N4-specific)
MKKNGSNTQSAVVVQEGIQLDFAVEYFPSVSKKVVASRSVAGPKSNVERNILEDRYADLLSERPDYRRLVTYVPNKAIPIYNWFKFKEGFSRQLVINLLATFGLQNGATVYDPFAGCGTTLLACKEKGLTAIGTDMLPVAVFVSQVKITDWPNHDALLRAVEKLFAIPFKTPALTWPKIKIIDLAFPTEVQEQILFFKEQIDAFKLPVRDFLMLGLLTILESVSRTSKDGQFLRLVDKPLPQVGSALRKVLISMVSDLATMRAFKGNAQGRATVMVGDARELCLPKNFHGNVDAIITSPPYLNRYDYSRSYALELCLFNVKSHHDMVAVRHSLLRSHIESREHENKKIHLPALDEILAQLHQKELNNERVPIMVKAYFEDMNMVIKNLATYLKLGGKVALVVANAQFAGESIPTDLLLSELAAKHGLDTEEIWITRYKGNSSQQMAIYGRRPVRESIVFWKKSMSESAKTELHQRYLSRSALFWKFVKDAKFAKLQHLARSASWKKLDWDWEALGITQAGRTAAESFGFVPTEVFAHPTVIQEHPELFNYYRLLACLPNKGLAQIKTVKKKESVDRCILLNGFISELLAGSSRVSREIILRTIFAEAGSEWQGTWVNKIGLLAAQNLEKLLVDFARNRNLIDENATAAALTKENCIALKSGTTAIFGSEPDIEFRNSKKELVCVIEIKGSADKAGAQTRLGETKKSFTKAKLENPRCVTIFLPSILTPAVRKQLQTERDIDKVFSLIDIFKDTAKREEFMEELFKYILRERI